jgi:hypothetical protein
MERVVGVFGDGRAADLDAGQPVALVVDKVADSVGNNVAGAIEGVGVAGGGVVGRNRRGMGMKVRRLSVWLRSV